MFPLLFRVFLDGGVEVTVVGVFPLLGYEYLGVSPLWAADVRSSLVVSGGTVVAGWYKSRSTGSYWRAW